MLSSTVTTGVLLMLFFMILTNKFGVFFSLVVVCSEVDLCDSRPVLGFVFVCLSDGYNQMKRTTIV